MTGSEPTAGARVLALEAELSDLHHRFTAEHRARLLAKELAEEAKVERNIARESLAVSTTAGNAQAERAEQAEAERDDKDRQIAVAHELLSRFQCATNPDGDQKPLMDDTTMYLSDCHGATCKRLSELDAELAELDDEAEARVTTLEGLLNECVGIFRSLYRAVPPLDSDPAQCAAFSALDKTWSRIRAALDAGGEGSKPCPAGTKEQA